MERKTTGGTGTSEERYISLLTDFGFKRIFGTRPNRDLLISFLNTLFNGRQVIRDVKYLNGEQIGDVYAERKAIFDVYCEDESGGKFIVEMQNAYQRYFKDRSVYYTTFPIREQAPKGSDWDFRLSPVYTVALLNFDIDDGAFAKDDIQHEVMLIDRETKAVFYDKLTLIYVEIAKFNLAESELRTMYDKWLYVLKNMAHLEKRPKALQERIFTKLFKEAEISQFTPRELKEYEDSKKAYRDIKNSIDTAKEQGMAEGMAKGRAEGISEVARRLLAMGMDPWQVAKATGLSIDDIHNIKNGDSQSVGKMRID